EGHDFTAVRIETLIDVPGNLWISPQLSAKPGSSRLPRADSGRIATNRPPGLTMSAACSTCARQRPSLKGGFITTRSNGQDGDFHAKKSACSVQKHLARSTAQWISLISTQQVRSVGRNAASPLSPALGSR